MSDRLPTIRIKAAGERGFVIINESDFDPELHKKSGADPLDHDGDGESGGSVAGYHSTAAKGARKRKAK